jgi:dolichol-phosphate mannosyltransferase
VTSLRSLVRWTGIGIRLVAAGVAISRVARAAGAAPPIRPTITPITSISVIVPARNEAERIGPLLDAIVGAPGVTEVLVIDDQSTDATADVARRAGATVLAGAPLPHGWAGKAWALHQGIAAAAADWIVSLDADTRPDPRLPTAIVARAVGERLDLLTAAARIDCPTPGSRWLRPAMLTTLVYRFGPPGGSPARRDRLLATGQCMAFDRRRLLDAGGMESVGAELVEDVALARSLAATGLRVAFLDASELLTVRMYESFADTRRGWGRSLALPGVEPRCRQLADLAVLMCTQVLPIPRLLTRRGDVLDVVLAAVRIGTLIGTRRAYTRGGITYWTSPLADPVAAGAIACGIARGTRQSWRGRSYG